MAEAGERSVHAELEAGVRGNLVRMEDEEISFRVQGPEGTAGADSRTAEPGERAALPEGVGWEWNKERRGVGETGPMAGTDAGV